jgi:hypothetical protein
MKMQSENHASAAVGGDSAPETRTYIFSSESDCALWIAALTHAMNPPMPPAPAEGPSLEKAVYSPSCNFLFKFATLLVFQQCDAICSSRDHMGVACRTNSNFDRVNSRRVCVLL